MNYKGFVIIVAAAALIVAYASAYTIDETEQVVVTQFGRIVGEPVAKPGLHFKVPFIQNANYFPNNLLEWDGDPGQIPTLEKTYIWVDTFARWKIVDPVKFFQTVNNVFSGMGRLDDIIDPATRNMITSHKLIETVRTSNRVIDNMEAIEDEDDSGDDNADVLTIETGRSKIVAGILKQAKPKLAKFGIELVDVQIKRINYVEAVRQSVYGRMIAERKQKAEKYRSEGTGEAQKILGSKERDLKEITSEAYKEAQKIKGRGDAEATKIFAEAYSRDSNFYTFTKTLEIYNTSLDKNSSLVLSTDSDFLKYLKGYSK